MIKVALIFVILGLAFAGTIEQWKQRTIYQLLTDRFALGNGSKPACDLAANTYCGGNFKGIQNNLPYIKGMGFDAIWISPIVKNYPNDWHGYAAMNIYEINPHFGTEQDFIDLVKACHDNDIWMMVDVVGNHMGNLDQNYTLNVPFNDSSNYHPFCIIENWCWDQMDQNCIENCRLASLADLKQEDPWVAQTLYDWIQNLVTKYNVDGLRIDTVPEVPKWFWGNFTSYAGVYSVGEVFNGNMQYVGGYVPYVPAVLNYPYFFSFRDWWINSGQLWSVRSFYDDWRQYVTDAQLQAFGLFIDNHDNPRFLSDQACTAHKDQGTCMILYKSLITYTLTSEGIPIIYYGTEQGFNGRQDPYNREPLWNNMNTNSPLYQFIATINQARHAMQSYNYNQTESYCDAQIYAFYRGKMFVAVTNVYSGSVARTVSTHPFSEGQRICNIFWPLQDCLTIQNGKFQVFLNNGESKIFIPASSSIEEII